jgi:hypothetical protein
VRAVVYSGYGIMPELAQVADPACPRTGWSSRSARAACAGLRELEIYGRVILPIIPSASFLPG